MSITYVVPVFNSAPYLNECLQSIVDQNTEGLEIIAINDASTDDSLKVLKQFSKTVFPLNIVNLKRNRGLGPVRNEGIKRASGEWIAFLDSDDKLQPGSVAEILQTAKSTNSQMVLGSVEIQIDQANGTSKTQEYRTSRFLNFHALNTNLGLCRNLINVTSSCAIVYSREFLFENSIYYQRKFQEDHDFVLHALLEAERVSIRGDVPYLIYRKRDPALGGLSVTSNPWSAERFEFMVEHFERVVSLLSDKKYHDKIPYIDALKTTRCSYYLGTFSNHILRAFFSANDITESERVLRRLSKAFQISGIGENGIDHAVESLFPANPGLSRSGFFELSLQLILDQKWVELKKLVVEKGFDADTAAGILFDGGYSSQVRQRLSNYMLENPSSIKKSQVPLPCIIPHNIDEVILHIGMTKTGSTSLQNFLETNPKSLNDNGYFYPSIGIFHDYRNGSKRTAGHNDLIVSIRKKDFAFLNRFREEISKSGCSRLIISCENFFHTNPEAIAGMRAILGNVPIKIVVYLRRQDSWIESYYAEAISGGHLKCADPFERFLEDGKDRYLDYFSFLEPWSDAFGKNNIVVRPYRKSDMVEDFCKAVGMGEIFETYDLPGEKRNISPLSKDKLNLLKEMNKLPFKDHRYGYRKFVEAFVEEFSNYAATEKFRWLSADARAQLLSEFETCNRSVERKYLKGSRLFEMGSDAIEKPQCKMSSGNSKIQEIDLSKSMDLYHRFRDQETEQTAEAKPAEPNAKPKSIAAKIYVASRGVPVFESFIDWVSPIHDRIFGVAR